jgi:hypothetical protein
MVKHTRAAQCPAVASQQPVTQLTLLRVTAFDSQPDDSPQQRLATA